MKKWWILALVLLLGLGGCARDAGDPAPEGAPQVVSAGEKDVIWERAPELTVSDGAKSVPALKCTTSWDYERPDGTRMAVEACGFGPLQAKEHMEPLVTNSGRAWLNFELEPDSVSVKCWSARHFGEYDVEGTPVQVEVLAADAADGTSTKTYAIPLKEGSWVYEVTAKWERSEKYGGTGYYGFYTE